MNLDPSFYVTSGSIPTDFKYSFTADSYWEIEPNGDKSYAMPIELDTMYSGVYCEESYDVLYNDYYSIELKAGKKYLLKIDNFAKTSAYAKIFDPSGDDYTFYDFESDSQEGKVYIWEYTPAVTGTHYVAMCYEANEAPIEYKIGVFEYICQHKAAAAATCSTKAVCAECGEKYGDYDKSNHSLTTLKAVAATCTKAGKTAGKKCTLCGKVTVAQKTVAAKGHSYKTTTTKATLTKNGKVVTKCATCGNVSKTTTVYYPKTIKLAKTAYTYNGKVQKPAVTVKDSQGNTLKKDKDYTVKYESGCKATGKYTVTITFKGNYSGTKKLNFTIAPKATAKVKTVQSTSAVKLTWSKVTGADGYRVYQYNAKTKKWVSVKTLTGTSYKVQKLNSGTTYKFRVQAYTTDDGTIWGANSSVVTVTTKLATPKITKLTAAKAKAAVVWSNVDGENGYELYASTKKDSGFKRVAVTKANVAKATVSKLASGKTYYFKVRAYKTVDGAKMYSAWSAVKSVKIK